MDPKRAAAAIFFAHARANDELLSSMNGKHFWRGRELPGAPSIERDDTGIVTIRVEGPEDAKAPLYLRREDAAGRLLIERTLTIVDKADEYIPKKVTFP